MAVEQFSGALGFSMRGSIHREFMENVYLDKGMLWSTAQQILDVKPSFFVTFFVDYVKI